MSLLLLSWSVACWTHWSNDGLWFQVDAPAHAITGLFYRDFFAQGLQNPLEYTRQYYARYQTIWPHKYPPVFHLLEAAAFFLFGPSPYVAKGVVLLCSLCAGCYTLAWLRRWIEPAAGLAAGILLLIPGVMTWSNAVMTNIPALMFGVAALYHVLCAVESTDERFSRNHLWLGCILAVLGILTHPLIGVVILVGAAWIVALRRWQILFQKETLFAALGSAIMLLPVAAMIYRWGPNQFVQLAQEPGFTAEDSDTISFIENLTYYARYFVVPLVGVPVLAGAFTGLLIGLNRPRFRKATILLLIWVAVPYLVLSLIWAKDPRYLLIVCPPLIGMVAIAMIGMTDGFFRIFGWNTTQASVPPMTGPQQRDSDHVPDSVDTGFSTQRTSSWYLVFSLLLVTFAVTNMACDRSDPMPSVRSIKDCTAAIEQLAPCEPVLYHGRAQGVFTFHLCARDPEYRRQMISLRNLLKVGRKPPPDLKATRELVLGSGSRWLVVEIPVPELESTLPANLREFLKTDEVQLVRSFPQPADELERLDVYQIVSRFSEDVNQPDCFELPQNVLGKVVTPIRR